ncbi:MAG: hypothetical protein CL678_04485 [Bdellovibrionaceae bacterium]|nr:hypothetical protein [Pseudobdellovibrionaceae bacterium]|tara:strand:- start:681 stop:1676 length:996 start_codon:yes stop_codon:yes gene_type:complete
MVSIIRLGIVSLISILSLNTWGAGTYTGPVQTIASFDASLLEAPESVAAYFDGTLYVSLSLTGQIVTISPDGTQNLLATLDLGAPPLTPCLGYLPIMGAIALDIAGNAYISVASCDPMKRGIWRVTPQGNTKLVASLPTDALPNGIEVFLGKVFVADSGSGRVWTASIFGNGEPAKIWAESDLLTPVPNPYGAPGSNGIQYYRGEMIVANSSANTLVAIPVNLFNLKHGGEAYVKHQLQIGCDDFTFDKDGSIYCTTDPFQTIQKIHVDGTVEILLDAENGLDGPTSATFGRLGHNTTLYFSNAAFPFFPSTGNGPSIQSIELDVRGYTFD